MSALIFVAVAVAWVVYLVPKALRHHEEASASRTVEQVSDRARVVARRDAVSGRATALVKRSATTTTPTDSGDDADVAPGRWARRRAARAERREARALSAEAASRAPITPELTRRRRAAAKRATQRRRRVLLTLLAAVVATAAVAIGGVISAAWIAVPAAVVAAWLVACRLMVRNERVVRPAVAPTPRADDTAEDQTGEFEVDPETGELVAVTGPSEPEGPAPGTWEPVPVTLPTYVAKAPASRTVRTIDLDSTGVWSSGRNAGDSELAREAEAQGRAERQARSEAPGEQRRASGS